MPKFYVTDAIDYANGTPHLGHAYEKVVTDCIARAHRQAGIPTYFPARHRRARDQGPAAAEKAGVPPQQYVDGIVAEFARAWQALRIEPDQFIRTTDPRHVIAVHALFERAYAAGDVYEREYEGLYCQGCEAFYLEKDLVDGKCPIHGTVPETVRETNFFFRLSKYAQPLLDHIAAHPEFIQPDYRRNEVVNVIKGGLDDISISRAAVSWGLPMPETIPGAAGQTIYVWFEALINYLTAIGYPDERYRAWWCGDDRPVAQCAARDRQGHQPLPLHHLARDADVGGDPGRAFGVRARVHLRARRQAVEVARQPDRSRSPPPSAFGADALRWYLAREIASARTATSRGSASSSATTSISRTTTGNLLSRSCSMLHKYRNGVVPAAWSPGELEQELVALASESARGVREAWARLQPSEALAAAWALVARANRYVEETKPWVLAKDPASGERLDTVLATLLEVGRLASRWAWPAIPTKAEEAWASLALPGAPRDAAPELDAWFAGRSAPLNAGATLPPVTILFPRVDPATLEV
jgi:methionyl-tRNA synthetase